jgi:5-methylthioadenosine/S-adenosylhomocysteine deaminase
MATHAAYSVLEFQDIVREHQMTPIELLDKIGMLRTTLNIGHGNFIADNPNLNYSGARDLELMGSHCCSISHCPINIARRARTLDNWKRYRDAGVNISIGSDTYPRDMVMNMRTASLMGKIMGHDYYEASAGEVFDAATLGGAHSLGRGDLGKLAPGALADILIIDFGGRQSLRFGPVRDPIKSLVECGVGDDIDTVIVNGSICMENGVIPGLDLDDLRDQAQRSGEAIWSTLQDWDPRGRTAEEASPWSFPLHSC